MLFEDYQKTYKIYHIIAMYDLQPTLQKGIRYDDKVTYNTKYKGFHSFIEKEKTTKIPDWVQRKKAIFASMNYDSSFVFHANNIILSLKINPKQCWIANEDLANQIYAPFFMKDVKDYKNEASIYLKGKGKELLQNYWKTSLSFQDNLHYRYDLKEGYNAEVMIFHNISPSDIEIEYIISGHHLIKPEDWKKKYCEKDTSYYYN